MKALDRFELWLVTGSPGPYGEDTLRQVAADTRPRPFRGEPRWNGAYHRLMGGV